MIAEKTQRLSAPASRERSFSWLGVAPDIVGLQTMIANLYMVGPAGTAEGWVLVDTGVPYFTGRILDAARQRFGGQPPRAIVLTHGHFDHVGTVRDLLRDWDVPVYAHEEELPYLTGQRDYPPPDPTVGGGLLARVASMYPRQAIDLGDRVQALPADGSIPEMPGWQWIHTPGHTPGHVSLYREADRVLLAGDAFVTTRQESALSVLLQYGAVHGPPAYFTLDWRAARESVRKLASLRPLAAGTGHGPPMRGERLQSGLQYLAHNFDRVAVPRHGRYVEPSQPVEKGWRPARGWIATRESKDEPKGSMWDQALTNVAATIGIVLGVAAVVRALRRRSRTPHHVE
ncbi:MAG TPA: MBL fold metallo-hydrolase [Phycisphaerae bacterium]|jgi:glyoxylase-like metal-dependent hydrolase (beta-lactamase superfamily II)|nr:MBL fold metallo-hydrolase [Phycisphaerae bacterium]HOB76093.1 MBL fold metallo-hydrolase [Phycisphaerae bacterium]HOJ56050.1 MBL fold metallo-hydrolase [Phycisphaerae bacterium]HOL27081.1 MBL fold metallo-hydrolase [Phycisphaerae bacterium]HPP21213.1 MBL fold metallo-hydrolase [Phycisphaerae bacterium]